MNNAHLAIQFFIQLAVILLFCRLVGAIALRLGQPQVVAEMVAGVLLGPSLFGLLWPEAQHWLFPWDTAQKMRDTQSYLFPVSQLGLALYMFVVGMEFRVDIVKRQLKSSIAVSVAGMVTPLLFGAALAWIFFHYTDLFPRKASLVEAMLFLGASMCITAFPVLARIIHYKKLSGTSMGTVALGAGAIDDASAWCLLAVVLASFDKNWNHALANIGGGLAYVVGHLASRASTSGPCQDMAGEGWHAQRCGARPWTCFYDAWCVFHRSDRIARSLWRVRHGRRDAAGSRGS